MYWAQRAYHNWIGLGDRNTKFFQTVATIQKRHNVFYKIMDKNGI